MDVNLELINVLGLYNIYSGSIPVIAPNTLNILYDDEVSGEAISKAIKTLKLIIGDGKPAYINDPDAVAVAISDDALYIKDAFMIGKRHTDYPSAVIYVPTISYGIMVAPKDPQVINDMLAELLASLVMKGHPINQLMREKGMVFYYKGKLITFPEMKERDMVTEGGIPLKALKIINNYVGRILQYIMSNIRFDEVKTVGKIEEVSINVSLPIKKVVVALDGEEIYNLDSPIILDGTIKVSKNGVVAGGKLKLHPNIEHDSGSICLGTIPPFDGTLAWIGRLLNTLSVARIDACSDAYGGVFIDEFKDVLPEGVVNTWYEECGGHDDEEYYDEDEYYEEEYDEGDDDWEV